MVRLGSINIQWDRYLEPQASQKKGCVLLFGCLLFCVVFGQLFVLLLVLALFVEKKGLREKSLCPLLLHFVSYCCSTGTPLPSNLRAIRFIKLLFLFRLFIFLQPNGHWRIPPPVSFGARQSEVIACTAHADHSLVA